MAVAGGKSRGAPTPAMAGKAALLPGEVDRPALPAARKPRRAQIVAAARQLLEHEGRDALTMRAVAGRLGIRAPSLYKHFPDKAALESAIIEDGLIEIGEASHAAIRCGERDAGLRRLLEVYRAYGGAHAHLYRLVTAGPLARELLPPGLEEWAGNPWYVVTGDAHLAQALWSFAHGMVVLELDGRYPAGSDLDETWRAGARAFEARAAAGRARVRVDGPGRQMGMASKKTTLGATGLTGSVVESQLCCSQTTTR